MSQNDELIFLLLCGLAAAMLGMALMLRELADAEFENAILRRVAARQAETTRETPADAGSPAPGNAGATAETRQDRNSFLRRMRKVDLT